MSNNPYVELEKLEQSIWLDFISKELIKSGELHRLIKEDHLKGLTSNPSIFEKAIAQTSDYDEAINLLSKKDPHDAKAVYENIAIADIQAAADILRPVYEASKGHDGFVSLEVSPHLAFDGDGTIEEAKRLWHQVDRANLMIKIPGTKKCMNAIRDLISNGINVNVTLLFSVDAYRDAAKAYLDGLGDRAIKGLPINSVNSVASFFVSRIDVKIDKLLEKFAQDNEGNKDQALALQGLVAIANAKMAYSAYKEIYATEQAKSIIRQGGQPQKLLWASTGTKNPNYSDVLYVDNLIGKNTVNTLPPETLKAFRDHGKARLTIENDVMQAKQIMNELSKFNIDFKVCCDELLIDGVKIFADSFDKLLLAVDKKLRHVVQEDHKKKV
ncbi:MAG: transaldolase [Myxococcales bacterium]|nr:transaldolase [Myxococcales bacterium]USN50054.1 MAG: transaldolase [Myxococcales bacterium]